jgi:hypothetical protein
MSEWYTDIEEPADAEGLRSKNLYGKTVLVRPQTHGEDIGEDGPYSFWNCDVVIIDRAGVEAHSSNVRIGWKLIQKGLANRQGSWILAKVVQKGTAWVLDPNDVSPAARQVAAGLRDEVEALFDAPPPVPTNVPPAPGGEYDGSPETF